MRLLHIYAVAACIFMQACSTAPQSYPPEVVVVEKPVPVPCRIQQPKRATPRVALVQLTGNRHVDALIVWRAAEAELEERIAYEGQLEAAIAACIELIGEQP